jgi:hypothetical protein
VIAARQSRGFAPSARPNLGLGDAAEHVYDAGQLLLERRIQLWAAQARSLARSGVGLGVAATFAVAGWFYFVSGVIEALARDHPRFAVLMGVGILHVALGGLFAWGARRASEGGGS